MSDPHPRRQYPQCLLLATDLSARCDRALDRAAQLAREWDAELVAVTVLESPQAPDLALAWAAGDDDETAHRLAQRQLRKDLARLRVRTSMRIAHGDPTEAIRAAANDTDCALIVTGMARSELLGRFLLGSTVHGLTRSVTQPLLVVRNRARSRYQRVVVATDFSEPSRQALHSIAMLFPDAALTLYHAVGLPMSGMATSDTAQATLAHEIEQGECARFLQESALEPEVRARLRIVIEGGPVAGVLTRYVRAHDVDLVAMGTHGRSSLMDVLIGSTASELLNWLPCDTLLVRQPRAVH